MKYLLMLLATWLLSFSYDSAVVVQAHKRAEAAAKTMGISPLWLYNKSTAEIHMATAEVQAVLARKESLNAQLLELCNDLQRSHNKGREIVECVQGDAK